jgi:hypothetical protein
MTTPNTDRGAQPYDCEDCIGMREHGCYCAAMGAAQPGGPATTQADLLPCPFCGSDAKLSYSRDGEVCNVRCVNWGKDCLGAGANCYATVDAIASWNRRAPTGATDV